MKLMSQKSFKRAPEVARPQMPPVICGEYDLSLVAVAGADLVRTSKCLDAAFDPEMLLGHFELHEMGWLNDRHALHHVSSLVYALDARSYAALVAFSPHRVWQQDTQQQWRRRGNILVCQYLLPNHFGARVKASRGSDRLSRRVSREEPPHAAEPSLGNRFGSRLRRVCIRN